MRFAYLHNHSNQGSIRDALASNKDYVNHIHKYNSSQEKHEIITYAITEHGNLFSLVDYHLACIDTREYTALKPIYGNEIYHVDDLKEFDKKEMTRNTLKHLVLIAKNDTGLKNLYKITTHSGMNKIKGKTKEFQITDINFLKSHGDGIIALSGCLGGKIGQFILDDSIEKAKETALMFKDIFEEFYLEIQPHSTKDQFKLNNALVTLSERLNIPLVITTDTHYVTREDKVNHKILTEVINIEWEVKEDKNKPMFKDLEEEVYENHMWEIDELIEYCKKHEIPLSAMTNTAKIADSCSADITPKDTRGFMPSYPCPNGYKESDYLRKLALENFKDKFIKKPHIKDTKTYILRINYELDIINRMNFSGYFLILWDWFKYCKSAGIILGPGRGSAAGCLIAYLLDITKVDPVENGLIMERFLNMERIEAPDVDSDVSKTQRREAILYLKQKYGDDYVCQINTLGKYKIKSILKGYFSTSKDKKFNKEFQDKITKPIPDTLGEFTEITYDLILDIKNDPDKYFMDNKISERDYGVAIKLYDHLESLFKEYPDARNALNTFGGCSSNVGVHAGGVVISSQKLSENIPIMRGMNDNIVLNVSQFNMDAIHYLGALKLDILGLNTLSQFKVCLDLIGKSYDFVDEEDFSDKAIYERLKKGNTTNVFQMHKRTPTGMLRDFNVENIEGVCDVNASNRPGPLAKDDSGWSMVDSYVEAIKNNEYEKIHPLIDEILEPTKFCLLYQEQCQKIGQVVAGYNLAGADIRIRGILTKKKIEKIPELYNEFMYGKKSIFKDGKVVGISEEDSEYCIGALNNGFTKEIAETIFNKMKEFAKYSFNKSHSFCYATIAYKCAWLDLYYPVEWAVACLSLEEDKDKKVSTLSYCKKNRIKLLPPHINKSLGNFSLDKDKDGNKAVRFGFSSIKGISDSGSTSPVILYLRERDGEFKSFEDFYNRLYVNNSTLREYVKINLGREKFTNPINKAKIAALIMAGAFDEFEPNRYKTYNLYIKLKNDKKDLTLLDEDTFNLKEKLKKELELLDFYASQHPLESDVFPYTDLRECKERQTVRMAGIFKSVTTKTTGKGKKFYIVSMEVRDGTTVAVNIFDSLYKKNPSSIEGFYSKKAKEGKLILIVTGKYSVKYGNIAADRIDKAYSTKDVMDTSIPKVKGVPELVVRENPMQEYLLEVASDERL